MDAVLVLARLDGAGNRFVLVDALAGPAPDDPPALARRLCAEDPFRPDGLLVLERDAHGELAMAVYNADGSRPEACGNGLRCLAWYAVEAGHAAEGAFRVRTDAGPRPVRVTRDATPDDEAGGGEAGGLTARVALGAARLGPPLALDLEGRSEVGVTVDMGNPHLVLWRAALDPTEVRRVGPRLERDPRFPGGTNVELAAPATDGVVARVWERGVGETAACGTGACAVAAVAVARGAATWPVRVAMAGGVLEVDRDETGELWLAGPVRRVDRRS